MPIEQMTDAELSQAHSEMLLKGRVAREEGDLDLAQRYLAFIRPMNAEMLRRIQQRRAA
jgi:hypothetical protein